MEAMGSTMAPTKWCCCLWLESHSSESIIIPTPIDERTSNRRQSSRSSHPAYLTHGFEENDTSRRKKAT
eukprot:1385423-Amphidinium_carterae.1